ncbi:hypothetical protein LA080_005171 [Diaporthe eres]|nr:hypothetical protein LA080_005171 [Diaporthe eres]
MHSTATRGLVGSIQRGADSDNVIYVSTEQRNDHGQACGLLCGLVARPSHSRAYSLPTGDITSSSLPQPPSPLGRGQRNPPRERTEWNVRSKQGKRPNGGRRAWGWEPLLLGNGADGNRRWGSLVFAYDVDLTFSRNIVLALTRASSSNETPIFGSILERRLIVGGLCTFVTHAMNTKRRK